MTASIAAVLVVWATSPSSMPPVVGDSATLSEEQRQVALSQKSVLFDEHAGTQILRDISSAYVDSVNPDKLFETGMRAMLGSLDPYTEFENEESNRDLEITIMGGYGGVGLGVSEDWRITASGQERDPTRFRVANAMEGYAYDAGLRPGDHLTAVDGKELRGKKIEEVTQLLRGKPGSPVTVRFQRDGDAPSDERQAQLTRQVVRLKDVPLALLLEPKDDQVGYILLRGFAADAGREVRAALQALQARTADGHLKSVILDLRGNPGGLLNQAVEVAEQFLPAGSTIVGTEGRNGPMGGYVSSKPPVVGADTRVVVLTDSATASAAEIVTGAIQDHDRGVVVGERTFGKGLVQEVVQLPFRSSLKFTVARYTTPSGRCIQATEYTSTGREGGGDRSGAGLDAQAPAAPAADEEEDGAFKATRIKDKDRKVFTTDARRFVRSGGGVEPDVPMKPDELSEVEYQLEDQNAYVNFAAAYGWPHPAALPRVGAPRAPAPAAHGAWHGAAAALSHPDVINDRLAWRDGSLVSDQVWDEFVAFVSDRSRSGFERKTRFDAAIDSIGKALVQDGFAPAVQEQAATLKRMVQEQLSSDLVAHRRGISAAIEDAMRQRVEPEKVRLAHKVSHDPLLLRAVQIARGEEYAGLLKPGRTIAAPAQGADAAVRTAVRPTKGDSMQ